jgi:hypothetical protein
MLTKQKKPNSLLLIFTICSAVIVYTALNSANKALIQIRLADWALITIDTR